VTVQTITQDGQPVDDEPNLDDDSTFGDDLDDVLEDVRAIAEDVTKDVFKGFRRFKNGIILKVGMIAVAVKVVDVIGKIVIENQRLKAAHKNDSDDE
jgi:hypothetical protein